jgi:hypothetical protein
MGMSQMSIQQSTQPSGKGGFSPPQQQSAQQNPINSLYRNVLGRDAEAEGMNYWSQRFGNTIEPNEVEEFTRGAQPELQNRQSTVTSGQPQMGQPNMYSNTIRPWDNASIQPQQSRNRGGKGKG